MLTLITIFGLLVVLYISIFKFQKTSILLSFIYVSGFTNLTTPIVGLSFSLIALGIVTAIWFLSIILGKRKIILYSPVSFIIIFFLILEIFATTISGIYTFSHPYLRDYITSLLLYLMILSNCQSKSEIIDFIYLPIFLIMFHSIFILLPYGTMGESYHLKYFFGIPKSSSFLITNPNDVAVLFCFFLPFLFYNKSHCLSIIIKYLCIILIPVSIIIILLTFSRMGFLMLFFTIVWNLYRSKNKLSSLIIVASISLGIVLIIGSVAIDAYFVRVSSISEGSSSRTNRWKVALKVIADKPLLGIGPKGLSPEVYNMYLIDQNDKTAGRKIGIHNGYLDIATKYGIPIFILFILIFYHVLKDLRKYRKFFQKNGILSNEYLFDTLYLSVIVFLIGMMFNHLFLQKMLLIVIAFTQLIINKLITVPKLR
jgi:O-antigen ligase